MDNTLPRLREDLQIFNVDTDVWTIHDKASGKYFKISGTAFNVLHHWNRAKTLDELHELINRITPCTRSEIEVVVRFCTENFLTQTSEKSMAPLLSFHEKIKSRSWGHKLIHGYLFFKIHLFNPDRFLSRTRSMLKPFFTTPFAVAVLCLFGINFLLVLNRWGEFLSTAINFANPEGVAYLALSIIILKTFHEFGHAYAAKYHGCRVPSMGIAFMVFYPMPYTDTTDAWRLSPSKRVDIALAGIKVEFLIAAIAMGFWLWLPEGVFKSLAFFIAGVSLVGTLLINLTPFMRFDGYYALSDIWKIENLHSRSFAQAKAFLKKMLWGIEVPVEPFSPARKNQLIAFAFATWIYRLILFAGIAYLVYDIAFKALGIILFLIEIGYFILFPIVREAKEWFLLRSRIRIASRQLWSWGVLLALLSALFIPYSGTLVVPAIRKSASETALFAEYDSRVVYVNGSREVAPGETILIGGSVQNDLERESAQRKLEFYRKRLDAALTTEEALHDSLRYSESAIGEKVKISAARSQREGMELFAPHAGRIEYDFPLRSGEYTGSGERVAFVFDPNRTEVTGFVEDTDLPLIRSGSVGVYFDPRTLETIEIVVTAIEPAPLERFAEPLLDSAYGGAVRISKNGIPERSIYKITMRPLSPDPMPIACKRYGYVKFDTEPMSLLLKTVSALTSGLIREASF